MYLLIHRGRAVGEDKIMETFWPGDPEKAQNSLYSTLHRLRKALEKKGDGSLADPVLHQGKGYGFNTDIQHSFDVEEFESSYEKGARLWESRQRGDAAAHFQRADRLYGGEFLEGVYEDWALAVRERLERKYLDVLVYLAQFYNEDGRFDLGISYAERAVDMERCEERAHAELMNGYFRSGKRDLAVRQYHTLCKILKDHLGLSPSPPTVRLHLQITQS
ncbi:MAG: winged helix-turn-helix domain-containing protein [Armatimonadetes bacterium]|nr:winged helix-turn-helix domain-containing protein [Armatimonadota bacterium]